MSEENDILHKYVLGIQEPTKGIYNLRKQEAAVETLTMKYPISQRNPYPHVMVLIRRELKGAGYSPGAGRDLVAMKGPEDAAVKL